MIQRHSLLIVVAAILLLIAGVAKGVELPWWVDQVEVVEPVPGEIGSVKLAGVWRDGCVPDAISSEHLRGDLHLTVTQPGLNVGCPEVESPWSLTHEFRAEDTAYSIFGTLDAVDPSNRNIRDLLSGPDLLAHIGTGRRAVFHGLESTGGPYASSAFDVSADGRVVVGTNSLKPDTAALIVSEAFAWSAREGMRSLGILPGGIPGGSTAYGVSANGLVTVGGSTTGTFDRSFRWDTANEMTALPALTEVSRSTAFASSADGQYIVGMDQAFTPGAPGTDSRRAYRWSEATGTVDLGVIHERGGSAASDVSSNGQIVVGNAFETRVDENGEQRRLADIAEPFVWNQTAGMTGLGHMPYFIDIDVAFDYYRDSRATAVSADGDIVVGYSSIIPESFDLSGHIRTKAFRRTEADGLVDLGHVPGLGLVETKAVDVSEDGSVIVGMNFYELPPTADPPPDWRPWTPFLWDEENGMRLLRDVVDVELGLADAGDLDGWWLDTVSAISDDGRTIVGAGVNARGEREAWRLVMDHDFGPGDANLDGLFTSEDLVQVFQAGEYEDGIDGNSSWATGDWNGDAEFGSLDLVRAFQAGTYEQGPLATANLVPEPSGILPLVMIVFAFHLPRRAKVARAVQRLAWQQ